MLPGERRRGDKVGQPRVRSPGWVGQNSVVELGEGGVGLMLGLGWAEKVQSGSSCTELRRMEGRTEEGGEGIGLG